ncbi:COG0714 MoxR-like ATPases [uncultured Caudovirales phage]|uniref:COG0714 MoxR-like ATPases n=1 Tax=uncultured Caudovirales phage TaxID=2100421 RepID=A0A6J5KN44_9CAUD|nr:COG0714 MoxR-like ATPases [uncultured Caudovirales phage]CAB4123945.1 COG0714 MoxR-like ATPases [uncultured Caudovirales phage]CAB5219484.1 COG0714 MoxR-like ATPases [uncultured Caudovirales phage]
MSEKITCQICGASVHAVQLHLKEDHADWTLERYQTEFPDAPLMSELAKSRLADLRAKKEEGAIVEMAGASAATVTTFIPKDGVTRRSMHELFALGKVKAAMNSRGEPIPVSFLSTSEEHSDMIPEIDDGYIFDIEILKNVLLGLELNIPIYAWGHAGTGKSTLFEQVAGRTNRPIIRVQHTVNTEESHIVGQWTVKEGHTVFELGPLALAMKYGWTYMADEYDFGIPSVLSVYQPVLEGKSLVIKEADHANRVIKPHPNFRFVATGNTNGSGDETGLYQGTNIQNEANYDRFGIVVEVKYMPAKVETQILINQAGIMKEDAEKLIEFGTSIREAYGANRISKPVSPRALINAAKIGMRRGSWRTGLSLAFINKMTRADREVVDGMAQRIFGKV